MNNHISYVLELLINWSYPGQLPDYRVENLLEAAKMIESLEQTDYART